MIVGNEKIILNYFIKLLNCKVINGTKELININIKDLNPKQPNLKFNSKETSKKYVELESKWYNSCSLNIKGWVDTIEIWKKVCDKDGFINSNYGWCIYSTENYKQFKNCLTELKQNKYSRRACMIYNRPSMWYDYKKDGMNEFMCTFNTQQFIRDNKLIYIINQRSMDFIYGFFNDFAWHCEVYTKLYNELIKTYPTLEIGHIDYNVGTAHIYEKHFNMLKKICSKK